MSLIGWLIYTREEAVRNSSYITWMQTEAQGLGMDLRLVRREDLTIGIVNSALSVVWKLDTDGQKPDFVVVRTMEPMLNAHFENLGVPAFNSSHVSRICNHKAMMHQYLAGKGIPMLDTEFAQMLSLPRKSSDFPFVIKSSTGRGGRDVELVHTQDDLQTFADRHGGQDVIVQKLGPVLGRDVRVFVIGKQIIAAVLRASSTDFRSNYSLGGRAELYSLREHDRDLVERIIAEFDFGLVGIDFLFDENGNFLLNEIEDVVGSRTLSSLNTGINLVRLYLEHIKHWIAIHNSTNKNRLD